jgi:hypothetical protein
MQPAVSSAASIRRGSPRHSQHGVRVTPPPDGLDCDADRQEDSDGDRDGSRVHTREEDDPGRGLGENKRPDRP